MLLLDVSGSMTGPNIDSLNLAVRDMLSSFAVAENRETEIRVSVITFGINVDVVCGFTKSSELLARWTDLEASGYTPLGAALTEAKAMLEDREKTPSRAYRPSVVLLSDGYPTDQWEVPMRSFVREGRSSKCDRLAMAIGSNADEEMLNMFLHGTGNPLFHAQDSKSISRFFKRVTMSTIMRTRSMNPNVIPSFSDIDID